MNLSNDHFTLLKNIKTSTFLLSFAVVMIAISALFFNKKGMSANWVAPYLSAAANLEWGGGFFISEQECIAFKELPLDQQLNYNFSITTDLTHYNHNPIGFAYLIKIATTLFPFTGDEYAIMLLQLLVHLLLCLFILYLLKDTPSALLFFGIFYMVNPLILKYVVFNFYYFWQSLPSIFILVVLIDKYYLKYVAILFALVIPFVLITRMTLILAILFLVGLLIYQRLNFYYLVVSITVFFLTFFAVRQPTEKNIFHTIYVGIAAYENPYVASLSDNEAYDLYAEVVGEKLNASISGNYYDQDVIRRYQMISRKAVETIFYENPWLFLKNATLNTLQLYSFGYFSKGGDWFNYLSALWGFIVFVLLLFSKKYWTIVLIAIPSITFTWFYPPIPAYMFGSYLFLVVGYYQLFENFHNRIFKKQSITP